MIVGAGPAGALAAIYLAKQNYHVEASQLPKFRHRPHCDAARIMQQQCKSIINLCMMPFRHNNAD